MARWKYFTFFFLPVVCCSFNGSFKSSSNDKLKNENVVVWFNPFVSFQDTIKLTKYNETSLTPLLQKIATRFSSIMVHMAEDDLEALDWQVMTVTAVAKLNAMNYVANNSSIPLLRVWISFHYARAPKKDSPEYERHFCLLTKMSKEANTIFPGSVYALTVHIGNQLQNDGKKILKRYKAILTTMQRHRSSLQVQERYLIGVMYDFELCLFDGAVRIELMKLVKYHTEIVFFDALTSSWHLSLMNNNSYEALPWFHDKIEQCRHALESVQGETTLRHVGVLVGFPDTTTNGDVNYSRFVQYWQSLAIYSRKTCTVVILDRAFDTPYLVAVSQSTSGWWRLKEDRIYEHPSQYLFEDKEELAMQVKQVSNPNENINVTWADTSTKFHFNHVGVRLFPVLFDQFSNFGLEIHNCLLEKISEHFHKVLVGPIVMKQDYQMTSNHSGKILTAVAKQNSIFLHKLQTILVFEVPLDYRQFKLNSFIIMKQEADKANLIHENSTKLILFNYENDVDSSYHISMDIIQTFITKNYTEFPYDFGIMFPLDIWCLQETNTTFFFVNSRISISTLAITAEVIWPNLVKGVERYLRRFCILLESCQNRIKTEVFSIKNHSMDLLFVLNWNGVYYEDIEIYKLAHFVAFWEGLNQWAFEKNTTVILGHAFDYVGLQNGTLKREGWWVPIKVRNSTSNIEQFSLEDKKSVISRLLKQERSTIKNSTSSTGVLGTIEIIWIALGVVILLTLHAIIQLYLWSKYKFYQHISKDDVHKFFKGENNIKKPSETIENTFQSNAYYYNRHNMPYKKDVYEIKQSDFKIDNDDTAILGSGEFGIVRKCKIFRATGEVLRVAVKSAKQPPKKESLLGLLSEIKTLSYIGQHQNIVTLVGAYTAELRRGIVYVFLEFCHLGSLQNHLLGLGLEISRSQSNIDVTHGTEFCKNSNDKHKPQASYTLDITDFADFLRWASEIASGMVYLTSKDVVHADLAARNILLTIDKKAKISDFGLSRRMYNYNCYVKSGEELLPWRWMAPESLRFLKFTEKSDIWSFGVLLWEIYSLGDTPYPGLIWNTDFANRLEDGLRLCEPSFNVNHMYSLMLECWHINPIRRPAFIDVQAILDLCKAEGS